MSVIKLAETLVGREVERLFSERPARYGELCTNPVTLACYIHGEYPIEPQKEDAYRALLAREWFAFNGPDDAQPLPLPTSSDVRTTLLLYIVSLYARSLDGRNYDVKEHPSFADYVSGVLWEAELPWSERADGDIGRLPGRLGNYPGELPELKKRFPPRRLAGMGPGFCWSPPKKQARTKTSCRRSEARRGDLIKRVERANSINKAQPEN
jgi:hypothetical protein